MKLLLFTSNVYDDNPQQILTEAEKLGNEARAMDYRDLEVELSRGIFKVKGTSVFEFDAYIFRGVGTGFGKNQALVESLVQILTEKNKLVLNGEHYAKYGGGLDKYSQLWRLNAGGVRIPKTCFVGEKRVDRLKWKMPYVMKSVHGSHGLQVAKIENRNEAMMFLSNHQPTEIIIQKCMEELFDYRVLVLGNQILGAMERRSEPGQFLNNISAGAEPLPGKITKAIEKISLSAAKVMEMDYAGVDLVFDAKGLPYVIEVNNAAEFQGFQMATGVNVAEAMVNYLMNGKKSD